MFDSRAAWFADYGCMVSAPCRRYVASAIDGPCSYAVKATERQFTIKQNIHFKNCWHFSTNYFRCPSIFKIFEINAFAFFAIA